PEPEPLPLVQSWGHVPACSPFVVSHSPSPHVALLLPLPPFPQSAGQTPTSAGAHTLSPHWCWVMSPPPFPSPVSSPVSDDAHANARAMARAQKIPALILIMALDGTP